MTDNERNPPHPMADATHADLQVDNLRLRLELERAKDQVEKLNARIEYQDKVNAAEQYLLKAEIRELKYCLNHPREAGFYLGGSTPFLENKKPEEPPSPPKAKAREVTPPPVYNDLCAAEEERKLEKRKRLDPDAEVTLDDVPF